MSIGKNKKVKHNHVGSLNPNYKHGDTGSKLHYVWKEMRQRCSNSNNPAYVRYGGKGVKVCQEWLDFVGFRDWALGSGYEFGLTIDRIDNDGNYEPSNCRWITRAQNAGKDAGKWARKKVGKYDKEGNLIATYPSAKEAARQTGLSQGNISSVCRGDKYKTAGGFVWKYE